MLISNFLRGGEAHPRMPTLIAPVAVERLEHRKTVVCIYSGPVILNFNHQSLVASQRPDRDLALADSAFVADAAATRLGNEVGSSQEVGKSIERALQAAASMPLLRGVLIIRGETMGAVGEIELIPLSGES